MNKKNEDMNTESTNKNYSRRDFLAMSGTAVALGSVATVASGAGITAFADNAHAQNCVKQASPFMASTMTSPEKALAMLQEQDKHFIKRIEHVSPNVYVAIGYHGATCSMIVGDDGVIMIDSLMGPESAGNAFADFRKYSDKPVKAIIYTHSHGDHTGGAKAFVPADAVVGKDFDVYGHVLMGGGHGSDPLLNQMAGKRDIRQFGRKLPKEEQTNRGLAPAGTIDHDRGTGYIPANIRIDSDTKLTIAGVDLELYPAAGETTDAVFIYLPKERVLFAGDNFYQTFPNLYAIRGTPYRDVRVWATSVAKMATFKPEVLVGGHTSPILGQKEATEALQNYSDAVQYVFDETIKGMNNGLDPITIAQNITLPEHLAQKPYLIEFYGTAQNASRAIYAGLMGWFDGNPTNLNPLPHTIKAAKMAELAGGVHKLLAQFEAAMAACEYQWAIELADNLTLLGADAGLNEQELATVRTKHIAALRALGSMQYNAPNRNYYLTYARELEGTL